jgi:hypothetical protein
MKCKYVIMLGILTTNLVPGRVQSAVVPAAGFAVRTVTTPDVVQGDVVQVGDTVLVGQGGFGPGLQRIVRLDGGVPTTIADGFGGLGGFSLAPDGTLYVVDNCFTSDFGCAAAVTGDTLYAIPDALTRTTALAASAAEVLPAGSIPFAFDAAVVPGGVLVSDAAGPGLGRVVLVANGASTDLVTSLGFAAGLARDQATLLVGDVDGSFAGSVARYAADGTLIAPLVGGLSGTFGVDHDGTRDEALVTGGFTPDFSSSTLVAVDASGLAAPRATGFGFSAGVFFDPAREETLVLDFGVTEVVVVCRDADTNGVCDAPCAAPVPATSAKLLVKGLLSALGDDRLTVKGKAVLGDSGALDPVADGFRLVLASALGVVAGEATVPGGAYDPVARVGWKTNAAGTSWVFRNGDGADGVTKAKLKLGPGAAPELKFVVKSKKRASVLAPGTATPLSARLAFAGGAECVTATFAGCTEKSGGDSLVCR